MKRLKSKAGFTLVELVVVIAIMAILAGVGTVGYGAYIKSANKGADKTLVGNIVRSIETGINSYAFPLDEVLQVAKNDETSTGGLTVPLGFVVVTNEGTTVYAATSTEGDKLDTGKCVEATIKQENGKWYIFDKNENKVKEGKVIFDKTNNKGTYEILTNAGGGYTASKNKLNYNIGSEYSEKIPTNGKICLTHSHIALESVKCDKKSIVVSWWDDELDIINIHNSTFVPWSSCGDITYDQYKSDINVGPIIDDTSCSLSQNLVASFGNEYRTMVLKGDWSKEEASISGYWSNASELMGKVQSLSGLLNNFVTANRTYGLASMVGSDDGRGITVKIVGKNPITADLIGDSHDSESDLVNDIACKITSVYTEDEFAEMWLTVAQKTDYKVYGEEGFGKVDCGREYFSSARIGFNSAFASYVKNAACGHASAIEDFGTPATSMVLNRVGINDADLSKLMDGIVGTNGVKMPYLVCKGILKGDSGEKFEPLEYFPVDDADDVNSFYYCNTCADNYDNWIKSGTCENDARAFYQTMKSVAGLPTEIKNSDSNTYFDYFKRYVSAMNQLYTAVGNAIANADSAVVIEVFYDGEQFNYAVSPTAANPRKE